jgi:hypothetical protein
VETQDMKKGISTFLLSHFPTGDSAVLTYDEFIEKQGIYSVECLFEWDRNFHALVEKLYQLISVPWPEIRWYDVLNMGASGEGRMIPQFINKKTFLHVFPSLINITYMYPLLSEEKLECHLYDLLSNFITNRLILHPVEVPYPMPYDKKWQFDLYDSLHEDVVKFTYIALRRIAKYDPMLTWEAIYSYWYKGFLSLPHRSCCEISKMETEITPLLLAHFPMEDFTALTYDEFIEEGGGCFYESEHDAGSAYQLIAAPWPEIHWFEIANIGSSGWMLPSFMNRKTFMHTFPSLLDFVYRSFLLPKEDASTPSRLMIESFIGGCLTLHADEPDKKWKLEFFDSLHNDVVRLIHFILNKASNYNTNLIVEAIGSYWYKDHLWTERSTPEAENYLHEFTQM